jgi:hypothetical protein
MRRFACACMLAATMLPCVAAAAFTVAPSPAIPSYGEPVTIQLEGQSVFVFLPATRYTRSGSTIVVDYEYMPGDFGPFSPQFGAAQVSVGELPAGNYTVYARLIDMDHPSDVATSTTANIAVAPPQDWGLYSVPRQPHANDDVQLTVRSAAYFDPASMRASVSGNTVRVDFRYDPNAPVGGPIPQGMTSFASVSAGHLAPGVYHAQGWGTPVTGGDAKQYFSLDFTVDPSSTVVEFYQEKLDHYFMAASPDEVDLLDAGGQGGWKRTGQSFHAWLRAADAPAGTQPVCRFYAAGPNSHFYTIDPAECAGLRALEQSQRAAASASGTQFLGWGYEGTAFWAVPPQGGACPAGTDPVWRAYNGRAAENDSNHRFTADPRQRAAMMGWIDEGVAFCSPH